MIRVYEKHSMIAVLSKLFSGNEHMVVYKETKKQRRTSSLKLETSFVARVSPLSGRGGGGGAGGRKEERPWWEPGWLETAFLLCEAFQKQQQQQQKMEKQLSDLQLMPF